MKIQIAIDQVELNDCGMTQDKLSLAVQNAVRKLEDPDTGDTVYLNYDVDVAVITSDSK